MFVFDINRIDNSDDRLTFSRGTITLASFDFEGEREQGEDVYFNQTFSGGLTLPFDPDFYIQELDFDIPQGIYTRIDISFETFDEYDEDNIVVEGIYKNPQEETIPILFTFKSGEYFSIVAEDYSGASTIVLNEDIPVKSIIKLDPVHWFQIISNSTFEEADLVEVNGVPTILVSEDENTDIFDLVVDRLDESTEAVFEVN